MADDFPLLTTLPEAPGLFEHRATLSYRDLRLRPFALLVDDFERFRLTYRLLLPRICGLVITYDTLYALERVDRFVWWLRVPTPCLGLMEEFLRGFLRTIEQLRDESRAKEKLQIDYERATSDISGLSDYVSIVEKVTRDELNERTRWMVGALSELVRFTAEKLEAAGSTDFPEQVTGFLCGPQFEYDGAALFIVREHAPELLALHGRAVPTRIQLGAAQIERGIWSEGPLLHSVFDVGGTTHLLVLACTKPLYKFSETEHSFTRLLTTIVASTYRVKMLAREVEERVVEISNIRTIARLVKGLRDETLSLSEAVHELFLSLSLEAVALLLPDSENGGVVLQRGVTFASYDEFLDEIERDDREQWRFVTLTDLSESERGVVACRLTAGNPTLHAIQRRVVDFFFVQIGLIYSERRFQQESITDPLTALFNRRYIMRVLNDRATLVRLDQTYVLSVVMIDIDRFKWINDAYGHQVGDEVLRAVATHLRESCRDSDVVGRYGGEEFIILMNAHLRGAVIAAEKMRQSLQPIVISPIDHPLEVTMSFGVATLDGTSARDIRDVIASADANLYVAKNAGRNRVIPSLFDGGEPEPIH